MTGLDRPAEPATMGAGSPVLRRLQTDLIRLPPNVVDHLQVASPQYAGSEDP
jgi:hypothetical protein